MFRQPRSRGDGLQHIPDFFIPQSLDFPFSRFLYPDRVEAVGDVLLQQFFPVELSEQDGQRRLLPGQGLVPIFVDRDNAVALHLIAPAVIQIPVDIRRPDLSELLQGDIPGRLRFREICLFRQITEERQDVPQVSQLGHGQHIASQITEKPP